jgi:RNA polymerase sigma-70 factor (ECF subfamily)
VSAAPPANGNPRDPARGTLGDLLFADKTKTLVSEDDWVALVRSISAGDQDALRALFERTHRLVFTLIMRITHNRESAEELTLDVFHDVWRRAPRYDPAGGSVVGWIMNQARSRAIDRLRFEQRKRRVDPGVDAPVPADADDPGEVVGTVDEGRALREVLAVLTAEERQAVETAFFSELTYAEAASRLRQPLGTFKTRIRSALAKLRQRLGAGVKKP